MYRLTDRRRVVRYGLLGAALSQFSVLSNAARKAKDNAPINALIIGASYNAAPANFFLANAVSDARAMADFLSKNSSFKVKNLYEPDSFTLASSLEAYLGGLVRSDIAFIYFAGHGVQVDGNNYIVSADGRSLIPIGDLVLRARERAKLVLLFLDACRNNPFSMHTSGPSAPGTRSLDIQRLQSRGLKRVDGPANGSPEELHAIAIDSPDLLNSKGLAQFRLQGRGIKVVFSTDPGNVAFDGVSHESNSPFTLALVKALGQPVALDDALTEVTRQVVAETGGKQTPWVQGSLEEAVYISGKPSRYNSGATVMPVP